MNDPSSDPIMKILKQTPGIILAGEALADLADDLQAVAIRALFNPPPPEFVKLATGETISHDEFNFVVDDIIVSTFGVTLHNHLFSVTNRADITPARRLAAVRAMVEALVREVGGIY